MGIRIRFTSRIRKPGRHTPAILALLLFAAARGAATDTPSDPGQITLPSGGGEPPLLGYQASPLAAPLSNERFGPEHFRASHFIHPLKTPSGFVLTALQPADHRHHLGLWWPWKQIEDAGRLINTWELQNGDGLVRATRHWTDTYSLVALAEYLDRRAPGGPRVLLNETAVIRLKPPFTDGAARGYILDLTISQTPAVDRDIAVPAYRYSGFSLRGTTHWLADNWHLLTSEGLTAETANGTRAHWIQLEGATPAGGTAGVLMMSHPANHSHPEPIRVWDNGMPFANFNPVQKEDWILQRGRSHTRRYRLFVYDGTLPPTRAETLWTRYAAAVASWRQRPFFPFDNGLTDIDSPDEQARLLAALGYDGLCTRPGRATPELLAACDRHGIAINATYIVLPADSPGIPEPVARHIAELAGRKPILWLSLTRPDVSDATAVDLIRQVCDLAATHGLEVALYPHIGFHTDTVAHVDHLRRLAGRPNLGLSFNLCHFLAQTPAAQLEDTIRAVAPHLKLVQINGADALPPGQGDWHRLIQPLGSGDFPVERLLRVLDEIGYDGPVNLQCYGIEQPAAAHLAASMAAWRRLLSADQPPAFPANPSQATSNQQPR